MILSLEDRFMSAGTETPRETPAPPAEAEVLPPEAPVLMSPLCTLPFPETTGAKLTPLE